MMSAPIASMFRAVSMKVSPLERLETLAEKSWVSAESRLAARLKLVRVRVEFSKKRLKTIRPWSAGTFLRLRVETSANESAVSRIAHDLVASTGPPGRAGASGSRSWSWAGPWSERPLSAPRVPPPRAFGLGVVGFGCGCCRVRKRFVSSWSLFLQFIMPGRGRSHQPGRSGATRTRTRSERSVATQRPTTSGWIGSSRWPRSTSDGQSDARRASQVADRVERRADCPAGEQDVVHQHDLDPVDAERDLGPVQDRPARRLALSEIVAVQGDLDRADGHVLAQDRPEPIGQPQGDGHSAGSYPDQAKRGPLVTAIGDPSGHLVEQRRHRVGVAQTGLAITFGIGHVHSIHRLCCRHTGSPRARWDRSRRLPGLSSRARAARGPERSIFPIRGKTLRMRAPRHGETQRDREYRRLMKIILANPRGFCAGVNMAIECLERVLEFFGPPAVRLPRDRP